MAARILIVEDNPANLDLMSYLLKSFGHAVVTAPSGEEGLETARREMPDLILCDIQLPGMDGYALAQAIKSQPALRAVPLVAVTALAMVGDRDRVLAAGFDGYIDKPIDPESFIGRIEKFMRLEQPTARPASQGSSPAAIPAEATRGTVLVVDDQPVNLSLNRSILEPLGFAVITASNIAQALASARQEPPDLIVSDVRMADGNGFEFIQAAKADPRLKSIPFVFVTSTYCDQASRARGLALGAARFLFRPIDPQTFLTEIEACLREAPKKQRT